MDSLLLPAFCQPASHIISKRNIRVIYEGKIDSSYVIDCICGSFGLGFVTKVDRSRKLAIGSEPIANFNIQKFASKRICPNLMLVVFYVMTTTVS